MIDYRAPLDELPDPLPIEPLRKPFDVAITPPGSKSITCRAYVLAALAKGESRIIRPLRAEDTDLLLEALCALGAEARWVPGAPGQDGEDVLITGVDGRFPRGGRVYLGDGGTPTRFMIAAACLAKEPVVVDASRRMRERPIAEGVDMLRKLGATIEYVEEEGRLPVRVVPSERFKGGELTVGKTASSQFISALMLIGPWLERGVIISYADGLTSAAYVIMTFKIMDDWHICTNLSMYPDRGWIKIYSGEVPTQSRKVEGRTFAVEPDASSAAYWLTAAAIMPNARMSNPGLPAEYIPAANSYQPDVQIAETLEAMGMRKFRSDDVADWIFSTSSRLYGGMYDAEGMPDASLSLAVACAVATGTSTLTGLHTLRVKETDRIAALANELRKVGCAVETTDDSITITPPEAARDDRREERADDANDSAAGPSASSSLRSSDAASVNRASDAVARPIVIETYNDHRMAMSFAILGLVRPGLAIRNPACVRKSYPTFWRDFAKLYE